MNKYIKYVSVAIILMAFAATAAAQPVITAVTTDTPTASSVNITWTTDENSDSLVKYGTTSGTYPDDKSSTVMVTSHSIELTGLNANTTYYYVVNSTDESGNSNESSERSFRTVATTDTTPPVITDVGNTTTPDTATITWTTDENSDSLVKYGTTSGTYPDDKSSTVMVTSHSIELTGLNANTTYYYVVNSTDESGNSNEGGERSFMTGAGSSSDTTPPTISDLENTTTPDTATITWTTNEDSDSLVKYDTDSGAPYEYNKSSDTPEQDHSIKLTGLEADTTYYFKVNSTDGSGNSIESSQSTFKTKPSGHSTGFRIWDADREPLMDLNYTWDARSFTGFYYDLDDDISTETLTVQLDGYDDRTIDEDNLKYITTAADIDFEHDGWGKYKVIGFMAEKYFAGYEDDNTSIADEDISLISKDMLSKVLIDEDEKHMISTGASLQLEEDYELRVVQLDVDGGQAQVELVKNGKSVDTDIVRSPADYIYEKDLGKLDDVPLFAVHITSVFAGTESDMLVIEGIFQVSDDITPIDTGEEYDEMEIKSSSRYTIEMRNMDDIDLEADETVDIMGNLKFIVADNDTTLRFALYEDITSEPGTHDIRGTVYDTTEKPIWDHMNFEGFYYDIDDDLGTEELRVESSGNTIDEDNLIYITTPNLVRFELDEWGSYEVIGFMAEPYFAGYDKEETKDEITNDDISLISKDMLSKVLIDVDDKRMISTGASLQLEEGYELRVVQLDVDGGQAQVELVKNGKSVDTDIVRSPDTYVYTKDLGKLDDVPIVAISISSVFAGTESDMLVIEGAFQISDDPISIDTGDEYGEMEITSATSSKIEMKNKENVIDLDGDETIMITDNIGFKVSEDEDRYYLFVRRTVGSLDSLEINFSEPSVVKEELTITVTEVSDGDPVEGAEVTFEGQNLGLTDSNGEVRFTSEESGTFTVAAIKENYDSASEDARILTEEEVKERAQKDELTIEMPDKVDPGDDVIIKVTSDGDAIEGANITWDDDDIGETDDTGSLTYTADKSGTYTVIASKDDYLNASEKITVVLPSAKFELSDLTLPEEEVPAKKEFPISIDVTNTGDLEGTYLAELTIDDGNGTVVTAGKENVTLDVGETKTVEFTHKIAEAGTYTAKVGTESGELSVKSTAKSKTTLVAAILIVLAVLGAIGYVLISSAPEDGWTAEKLVDAIKEKFQRERL